MRNNEESNRRTYQFTIAGFMGSILVAMLLLTIGKHLGAVFAACFAFVLIGIYYLSVYFDRPPSMATTLANQDAQAQLKARKRIIFRFVLTLVRYIAACAVALVVEFIWQIASIHYGSGFVHRFEVAWHIVLLAICIWANLYILDSGSSRLARFAVGVIPALLLFVFLARVLTYHCGYWFRWVMSGPM